MDFSGLSPAGKVWFVMRSRTDLDEPMGGRPKPAPEPDATVPATVAELPADEAPRKRAGWPKGKPRAPKA